MRGWWNGLLTGDPHRNIDAEIGDTIEHLSQLLSEADSIGAQFQPAARMARIMLRAVSMR